MNKQTCQTLIDDVVKDISETLLSNPSPDVCKWWRGRLSGVLDTVRSLHDGLDDSRCDAALDALYEHETGIAA